MITRYYCGNGDGMFEDKKGNWIEYKEYLKLKRLYNKAIDETFKTVDCYVTEYVDSSYNQMMQDLEEMKKSINKKYNRSGGFRMINFQQTINFNRMKNYKLPRVATIVGYTVLAAVLFAGCADVTPIEKCAVEAPYGFWSGLWHGIIAPISFIGSLFSDDIAMYAVNNTGGWYDFGFVLGAGISFRSSRSSK